MNKQQINLIKRYMDLSLYRKMFLMNLILVFMPILVIAYSSINLFNQIIVKNTIQNSIQNLELIHQSLFDQLAQADNLFYLTASNSRIQLLIEHFAHERESEKLTSEIEIKSILDTIIGSHSSVHSIVIQTMQRSYFGSSRVDLKHRIEDVFMPNLIEPSVWEDMHTVHYVKGTDHANYVTLNKPMFSAQDGRVLAYVKLNIDEKFISSLYTHLDYGKTGYFNIVNSSGTIVSVGKGLNLYQNINNTDYFQWLTSHDKQGQILNVEGRRNLITTYLLRYGDLQWNIVGVVPVAELLVDVYKVIRFVLIIGLVSFLVTVAISYYASRSISQPLIALSRTMVNVGAGDFEVRVKVASNDEVGLLASSFNKMLRQISALIEQVYHEQNKKRKYEFLALQAQIKPHFLYNTLDSISSLIQLERNDESFRSVQALSQFYKIILSKGRNIITIEDEIENVRSYLTIQKMRYMDKFEYTMQVEAQILTNQIIKLTLQPLVENAIYHGLRNKRGSGSIHIEGILIEDKVKLSVIDDGVGFDPNAEYVEAVQKDAAKTRSFGMRSVNERIQLYYGKEYGIKVSSGHNLGTRIDIYLPTYPLEGMEL